MGRGLRGLESLLRGIPDTTRFHSAGTVPGYWHMHMAHTRAWQHWQAVWLWFAILVEAQDSWVKCRYRDLPTSLLAPS